MLYSRFGRTELQMPVLTLGCMRFMHSWNADDKPPTESDDNVRACVLKALSLGMNHIETARGYGTSEKQLGKVLPELDRGSFIFQSKVGPREDPKQFRRELLDSFERVGLDYWDLFSIHGLNSEDKLDIALKSGCLDVVEEFREKGMIRHIGFTSHASSDVIVRAIDSNRFDYVNLHWFWINQHNNPALKAAASRDMGVLIISPNDKGGKLFDPPEKLVELCRPLSPMVFNQIFCLSRPEIQTLSMGVSKPEELDEHQKTLEYLNDPRPALEPVMERLNAALEETWGKEFLAGWHKGVPKWDKHPDEVAVWLIVWLMIYAKALDMVEYGKMRYNLLGSGGDWFPGLRADDYDETEVAKRLLDAPFRDRILEILGEAQGLLGGEEVKRLGGDH